jgi:Protein of unknown function (DUF2934)
MPASARAAKPPIEMLPREEQIRRRAYELYLRRADKPGSEIGDWLQAEGEIVSALARKAKFDRMKKLSVDRKLKTSSRRGRG